MDPDSFRYTPACQYPGCTSGALYKIAAAWSDGTFQELKTYAIACASHRDLLLAEARERRAHLRLGHAERVDDVAVYQLAWAQPDDNLPPVAV